MPSPISFPEQARTLGALLRSPYRKLSSLLYTSLAGRGFPEVRPAHSAVFRHISPEGSRLTDLAELADMTKQSMAYLVNHLEEQGYVQVRPDPTDGRARLVRLTARGRRLMAALLAISSELEQQVAQYMSKPTLTSLRNHLEELDTAIATMQRP